MSPEAGRGDRSTVVLSIAPLTSFCELGFENRDPGFGNFRDLVSFEFSGSGF